MNLDKILAISEKPGLFRLVTQTRSGLVAESLDTGKRMAISLRNNISLLSEIAIYTLTEEKPLQEVFELIAKKEKGDKCSVSHKDSKDDLEAYFFSILPDYDEDRVYASDIKKVVRWYNLLHDKGFITSDEEE